MSDVEAPPPEAPGERKRGGRKAGQPNKRMTAASISREIREVGLTSFRFVGAVQYLNRVAKKNPAAYLAFIAKLIKNDDGADASGITFIVQQVNVQGVPIAGVMNSPIVEHVVPLRLAAVGGEVVDDVDTDD